MTIYSTFIRMIPKGKGRHRTTKGGHSYPDPKTVKSEQLIQLYVGQEWRLALLDEPLQVHIVSYFERPKSKPKRFVYPTGKPDWDNIGKLVCDALNGILWRDDSVIVDGSCCKRYCDIEHPSPGISIVVGTVE
jgi:Holliday junction resolvase RusA-like endonuclease